MTTSASDEHLKVARTYFETVDSGRVPEDLFMPFGEASRGSPRLMSLSGNRRAWSKSGQNNRKRWKDTTGAACSHDSLRRGARRMEKAGALITAVDQIISELVIDWTSPNGNKFRGILDYH